MLDFRDISLEDFLKNGRTMIKPQEHIPINENSSIIKHRSSNNLENDLIDFYFKTIPSENLLLEKTRTLIKEKYFHILEIDYHLPIKLVGNTISLIKDNKEKGWLSKKMIERYIFVPNSLFLETTVKYDVDENKIKCKQKIFYKYDKEKNDWNIDPWQLYSIENIRAQREEAKQITFHVNVRDENEAKRMYELLSQDEAVNSISAEDRRDESKMFDFMRSEQKERLKLASQGHYYREESEEDYNIT